MKKIKVMLSAILVMGIVAGVLAFKVKSTAVCAYSRAIANNPPATTICLLTHATTIYTTRLIAAGASTQYATTIAADLGEDPCPSTTAECDNVKTLGPEVLQ